MRIVHISDLHITDHGHDIWNVNTYVNFRLAVEKIKQLNDIDAVIISGDLSNDGSLWSYQQIDEMLSEIGIPTFCCPGNHDNLDVFYNVYTPKFYKVDKNFKIGDWTFIMQNSAVMGMSRGYFNALELSDLLSVAKGYIAIVLHHPPIEQNGWLNRKLLENRDEFKKLIENFPNVKLVLYGHTHFHSVQNFNGITYSSASSIGFAFNPKLPKFEIARGEEGFSVLNLNGLDLSIENVLLQR